MIGDGVNDVLSLKKANLAIAMGSGSQATRGVADLVLMDDSFAAVAQAVEEGQRILNGMQDILKLFLTRIATVGLVVVSSLVVVGFPIELRNASALTVFTVGIPSALLAVWAQPGPRLARVSLDRTLRELRDPGGRRLEPRRPRSCSTARCALAGAHDDVALDAASAQARTALTSFLVFIGLMLIVFVEPPIALVRRRRADHDGPAPAYLALGLGHRLRRRAAQVPPARDFFQLIAPAPAGGAHRDPRRRVWVAPGTDLLAYRVVDRFLGRA